MTIVKMREAIKKHCTGRACSDCAIYQKYGVQGFCYSTPDVKKITRNYKAIFGDNLKTPDDCDNCEHEFDDKTKPPCVNCEGNTASGTAEANEPQKPSIQDVMVQRFANLCDESLSLYAHKNADYGNSFHKTFLEEGMAMPRIRLSDKLERFKNLTRKNEQSVKTESIRDTLLDLACYSLMTVMELDGEQE